MIAAGRSSDAAPHTAATTRRSVIAALRAAGAERVSDHFIVPATGGHPAASAFTASRRQVYWRERRSEHWVRTASVPFDLLPLHSDAIERRTTVFSLGPGLDTAGSEHPAVLLMQIEGTERDTADELARLMPLLSVLARELRMAGCRDRRSGRLRTCVTGIVPCT